MKSNNDNEKHSAKNNSATGTFRGKKFIVTARASANLVAIAVPPERAEKTTPTRMLTALTLQDTNLQIRCTGRTRHVMEIGSRTIPNQVAADQLLEDAASQVGVDAVFPTVMDAAFPTAKVVASQTEEVVSFPI